MKPLIKSTLALALAAAISSPFLLANAAPGKGASQLMWNAKQPVSAAPARMDCPTGMNCAKCKNVPTQTTTSQKGRVRDVKVSEQHLCGSCSTASKTVGTGKAAKTVFEHTCADGKTASASCCN